MRRPLMILPVAFALAVTPGAASAANTTAAASVQVVKPVLLTKLQDLDFGTLTFAGFTGSRQIVLSRAGAVTCAVDIVCSGATKAARFNVQGSNKVVVNINVSPGTLSNGSDSIAFTPDFPATVTLTSSGVPGVDFNVGGTITVSSTLVGGLYTGTINVTADNP